MTAVRAIVALHTLMLLLQPISAGAMLGGAPDWMDVHRINGGLLTSFVGSAQLVVLAAMSGRLGRLPAGLAFVIWTSEIAQMALGNQGVVAVHVPLGTVAFALAVMLTVVTWRAPAEKKAEPRMT